MSVGTKMVMIERLDRIYSAVGYRIVGGVAREEKNEIGGNCRTKRSIINMCIFK